jgi:hypothetical protein
MYPKQMYFIVLLLLVGASGTALRALDRSSYSRRAQKKSTAEANYFYFNSSGFISIHREKTALRFLPRRKNGGQTERSRVFAN